jgi:hypothetical protein
MVRVRPLSEKERKFTAPGSISVPECVDITGSFGITATNRDRDHKDKEFNFDRVFKPSESQADVFQVSSGNVIKSVLEGFSGTVMAYGQTGSGKTYTMQGDESGKEMGVIPRMAAMIFDEIAERTHGKGSEYLVTISYIEVYAEKIYDLLTVSNQVDLKIRHVSPH